MTTRHVERLIDFNHEMMEPLQFHIDEDIHYKKEEVGIRASGYLYLSGKYKAKEGIRLFQELLEVDILAPFEKIVDESAFAVHVKDYDYSVRDGDLLIDITIEIDGLDEASVRPEIEDELGQLESEMLEEDLIDDMDEAIDEIEESLRIQQEMDDLSEESMLDDEDAAIDEYEQARDVAGDQRNVNPMLQENLPMNPDPIVNDAESAISLEGASPWNLADLIAFENDNTNFGLDFSDQKENENLLNLGLDVIPKLEQQIRNYVTSKELKAMLDRSMDEMGNEPVRILFDLQEIEDAIPVAVTTSEASRAVEAWKAEIAYLQGQAANVIQVRSASYLMQSNEMADMIHKFNMDDMDVVGDLFPSNRDERVVVDQSMIHDMNESIDPKDASYYHGSHARKPLKNDAKPRERVSCGDRFQSEPKLPNLDVPFTRDVVAPMQGYQNETATTNLDVPLTKDTIFPWEMKSMYDKYEFSVQPNPPTPQQSNAPIRSMKEREGGCMNLNETGTVSAEMSLQEENKNQSAVTPFESDEMREFMDLFGDDENTTNEGTPSVPRTGRTNVQQAENAHQHPTNNIPSNEDEVYDPEAPETVPVSDDVNSIEDLFEDADSKVVNMRIVIARENDSYESIARRYSVNEKKLAQQNHQKPIHERTLVVIPLD